MFTMDRFSPVSIKTPEFSHRTEIILLFFKERRTVDIVKVSGVSIWLSIYFLQEDKRDEMYINIVDNEELMKSSPSRGFRSTTVYFLFISNPLQQKINFYVSITIGFT